MLFVFVRPGSITLSWTVSCFMATLSIEGAEKDTSAAVYCSLLKLIYRPFAVWILRKKTPNWSLLKLECWTVFPLSCTLFIARLVLHLRFFIIWTLQSNAESRRIVLVEDINLLSIDWSSDLPISLGIGIHAMDRSFIVCNCPEIITNVLTSTPERFGFPADHHISEFTVLLKFKLSKSVRATPTISNAGIFKIFAVSCHIPLWKLHFLEALTRAELYERIFFRQL